MWKYTRQHIVRTRKRLMKFYDYFSWDTDFDTEDSTYILPKYIKYYWLFGRSIFFDSSKLNSTVMEDILDFIYNTSSYAELNDTKIDETKYNLDLVKKGRHSGSEIEIMDDDEAIVYCFLMMLVNKAFIYKAKDGQYVIGFKAKYNGKFGPKYIRKIEYQFRFQDIHDYEDEDDDG